MRGIILAVLLGLTALIASGCTEPATRKPGTGNSPAIHAMPIGVTASAIVELSDMYRSPETYDVRITVLKVLRGQESAALIKESGESNVPAQNGFEYVLANIRFEYSARGAPGDKTFRLSGKQFHAFSGDGTPYGTPSIALPEPELAGALRSGDSRQGWIAFEVSKQDKKPLMIFDQGNVWFQIY